MSGLSIHQNIIVIETNLHGNCKGFLHVTNQQLYYKREEERNIWKEYNKMKFFEILEAKTKGSTWSEILQNLRFLWRLQGFLYRLYTPCYRFQHYWETWGQRSKFFPFNSVETYNAVYAIRIHQNYQHSCLSTCAMYIMCLCGFWSVITIMIVNTILW